MDVTDNWDITNRRRIYCLSPIDCKNLTDDDFDVLGDYYMGKMIGSSHAFMNIMMTQRFGDEGKKQIHIAMRKRLSGCDTNAAYPEGAGTMISMMGYGVMRGNTELWSAFGLLTRVLVVVFLILGIVYFGKGINEK